MLKVINRYDELDFRQLMDVYAQRNCEIGAALYPKTDRNIQLLYAEQDFFQFLQSYFKIEDARYFIWAPDGRYMAALRIEPYLDGVLLEGLETAPKVRRKGVACALVSETIRYLETTSCNMIYSHVSKDNTPSLALHYKCGFSLFAEDAVYIDGTYHEDSYTLTYNI